MSLLGETGLSSLRLFCLAAEAESFTQAAQLAEVTPAAVSRLVSRLEHGLRVQLFVRSTRRVRLTEAGRAYYQACRQALALLANAEAELSGSQQSPAGKVRISLPTSYAHHRVFPLLPEFHRLYPEIALDLHISNRNVDFTREGFDLAIRARVLPDSTLIARKLEDADLVVVGSRDYLARRGTPVTLEDLEDHLCLEFGLPSTGQDVPWVFRVDGAWVEYPASAAIRCTGDILGPVTLARQGLGLVQTYRFIVEKDLAAGDLVEVLSEYGGASRPFSLIYPSSMHLPRYLKICIDFLVARLSR